MENASKALIIAGAILLAILIIGLGVFIYNQASNTVGETGMDGVAIRQFNGQFEPYINKTIDSTSAKALIDTVNQSNQSGKNIVKLIDISEKSQIMTGHKYEVTPDYKNGVIIGIGIIDANNSSTTAVAQEHSITESTEEFNHRFERYIGNQISIEEHNNLIYAINEVNSLYGEDTVRRVEISDSGTILYYNVQVTEYYNDGKVRTIYITPIVESGVKR